MALSKPLRRTVLEGRGYSHGCYLFDYGLNDSCSQGAYSHEGRLKKDAIFKYKYKRAYLRID